MYRATALAASPSSTKVGRQLDSGQLEAQIEHLAKNRTESDTWNDAAVEAAWSSETPQESRGFQVYAASKVQGEKEAWKWVEENKPGFTFNTVLPPFNVSVTLSTVPTMTTDPFH